MAVWNSVTTAIVALGTCLFAPTTTLVDTYTILPPLDVRHATELTNGPLSKYHKHGANFSVLGLNGQQMEQLKYVQALDLAMDDEDDDPDTALWKGVKVSRHWIIKTGPKRKVLVKVHWRNDGPTWQSADAVCMQQPELLVNYAFIRGIAGHPDWKWTSQYLELSKKQVHIVRAFKAVTENSPKFKFGVEVPQSIQHALYLDKKNGNHLWQEAIETELQQINQYQTFWVPGGGVDLSQYTRIPYHFVFDVKFDL